MKKAAFILVAIAVVVAGLLIGTLNAGSVSLDLLWYQFELPLGLTILLAFSIGTIVGLTLAYTARILPLRLQLRKARAALNKQDPPAPRAPDD